MISHKKRFIFVHIPKTGGTSVAWTLRRHGIYDHDEKYSESLYYKHAQARDLQRILGPEFERYYRFTVVRNPWDWAVSSYAFNRGHHGPLVRGTGHSASGTIPEKMADWTFKPWLRWWIDTLAPLQSTMLTDHSGRLLVDRIIRFEELDAEFTSLCLRLRVWPRRLPHVNDTKGRGHYMDYYDEESRAWIAQQCKEDIDRFGYKFEGPRRVL